MYKEIIVVKGCCSVGKKDFVYNNVIFEIIVDLECYEVCVDGEFIICEFVDIVLLG